MGKSLPNTGFLLLIAKVHLSLCVVSAITCIPEEKEALLKLKASFTDPSNRLASWVGEDCCKWVGVGCNETNRHVIMLDLRNDPYLTPLLASGVDSSLLELKYLSYLDLSGNNFNLSHIPTLFGSVKQLQYLNLSFTSFSGKVPPHLGNLTHLRILDLSFSSQSLFIEDVEWMSGLSFLHHLDMSWIDLGKALNLMKVLITLPSLKTLSLSNCQLQTSQLLYAPLNSSNLPTLEILLLSGNRLNGSIPDTFQKMTSLKVLNLSFNKFSSSIPLWLGNIRSLIRLEFERNEFTAIEGGLLAIIKNMCSLKVLNLASNSIRGDIVQSHGSLSGCVKYDIEDMDLSRNKKLGGKLPDWLGQLKLLKYLDLSYNSLYGSIPYSIGNLSNLAALYLDHNQLSGFIPTTLGQLKNLEVLLVSNNLLEGTLSEVHFANLSRLYDLTIGDNNLNLNMDSRWVPPFQLDYTSLRSSQIGPQFPEWLKTQKKLSYLDMFNNSIATTIPTWLWELNHLSYLDLSYNQIIGELPHRIATTTLEALILRGILIKGSLPISPCKLKNLVVLDLSENRLTGKIPNCFGNGNTPKMVTMALMSNDLSGDIPNSIGNLSQLGSLQLSNNHLNGEFPFFLRNCTNLRTLDLGDNEFSGKIPLQMGSFQQLEILRLRNNKFDGTIPSDLCQLSTLRILDLADNKIVGTIPKCLGNLSRMQEILPVYDNYLYCSVAECTNDLVQQVIKGHNYNYSKTLKFMLNMDLSKNHLVGLIPKELTQLIALIGLNLSHNDLSGTIPEDMGKMKSLQSLDLSSNQLYGPIPTSMADIIELGFLNLSYNNFSGSIPKGNQLQTFDYAYSDNPYLCGQPLSKKCFDETSTVNNLPDDHHKEQEEDKSHRKMWFYIIIMLGYATGFWGVVGVLILNKGWRHAYFQFADEMKDQIHVKVLVNIARMKRRFKREAPE